MEDIRKLKDEAAKAFSKGKFARAVELYDEVCKADPRDLQAQIKLGDTLVKAADKARAVRVYQRVAETYASQGFLPKAIAVSKVILEVDPKHSATQQILASLYARKLADLPMRPSAPAPSAPVAVAEPAAEPVDALIEIDEGDLENVEPAPAPVPAPPESAARLALEIELSPAAAAQAQLSPEPEGIAPEDAPPPPSDRLERSAAPASTPLAWDAGEPDSIESQLEHAVDDAAARDPALAAAEAQAAESDASVEIAFDVPMADSAEEEIELLSVTAELERNAGRELPRIPLFSDLAPEAFVELMEQCGFIRAEPGQRIIAEGETGNSFFVVCSGKMRVEKDVGGEVLLMAHLGEGAFFGELALLSGARRAASVVAEEESELLEISAPVLNGLARRYPHVAASLREFGRQRLLADVMATSALFRPFERADRKRLVELFKVREVKLGEAVVTEGTATDGLYLIMTGEVDVVKSGADHPLATLHEGDVFGEMSLLSKKPATATVTARRRSTVLRLPRDRFEELIVTYPQVLVMLSDLVDARTRTDAKRASSVLLADGFSPLV